MDSSELHCSSRSMPSDQVPEFLSGVVRPGDGAWERSLDGTAPVSGG